MIALPWESLPDLAADAEAAAVDVVEVEPWGSIRRYAVRVTRADGRSVKVQWGSKDRCEYRAKFLREHPAELVNVATPLFRQSRGWMKGGTR